MKWGPWILSAALGCAGSAPPAVSPPLAVSPLPAPAPASATNTPAAAPFAVEGDPFAEPQMDLQATLRQRIPVDVDFDAPTPWLRAPSGACDSFLSLRINRPTHALVRDPTWQTRFPADGEDPFHFITWQTDSSGARAVLTLPGVSLVPLPSELSECRVEVDLEQFAAGHDACMATDPIDLGDCRPFYDALVGALRDYPSDLADRLRRPNNEIWWIESPEPSDELGPMGTSEEARCTGWRVEPSSSPPTSQKVAFGALARIAHLERSAPQIDRRRYMIGYDSMTLAHILPTGPDGQLLMVLGCAPAPTRVSERFEGGVAFDTGERWFFSRSVCERALAADGEGVEPPCG